MKNRFVVTACRFHAKEKNKLFVSGWFWGNQIQDNKLFVLLDNKKLFFSMQEKDLGIRALKSKDGMLITKEYHLWIDLPKGWRDGKRISIINTYQQKKELSCKVDIKKLKRMGRKVPKYVDFGTVTDDGFSVTGWYINHENVKISFLGMDGKNYPVDIQFRKRPDVLRSYPEALESDVVGFVATYKGDAPKNIRVCFKSDTKSSEYIQNLQASAIGKAGTRLKYGYDKIKRSYYQFGTTSTIKKIFGKLIKRDTISYRSWYKMQCPSKRVLAAQRKQKFAYMPKVSIVVPLYKTPKKYLIEMIESVKEQSYSNWELCLSDGSGANSSIKTLLKKYENEDKRIKVVYNEKPLQISDNTNQALNIATGDFIAFFDHDDLLALNALFECVLELNKNKDIDIIYTDEDKIDMNGKEHFMPHFKTDFNIDMLRSTNYICHFFVVKRHIYEQVGMLNHEFDGAQDYDFVLRCIEKTKNIQHIPKILYHWRAHKDSTAGNPESKGYAFLAGARAVQAHYDRLGINAEVSTTELNGVYRTKYKLAEQPLISVVIPNKDHRNDLDKCLRSLRDKNKYTNLEYIIVENNSEEKETFDFYKELEESDSKVKVVYWEGQGFNYPSINNFGVSQAKGDYILFLNNDTEILNEDCIEEMLGFCMRDDVGAVGARLYYEDETIQHAGVIVGLGGIAGHAFPGAARNDPGYFGRIVMAQDYSAVTAACMMVKKNVFEEVDGFDERYAVAFNDVDFCLKVRKAGYLVVYNPYAELKHYESKSRGYEDSEEKVQRFGSEVTLFANRWKEFLEKGDPYYSPNLTLDKNDFSLNAKQPMYGIK